MASDLLTPAQIAEIRERLWCDAAEGSEQTASDEYCAKCGESVDVRHGCEWTGGFSWCDSCSQEFAESARADIPALLAALDAATAEVERMRKAARRAIHSSRGVDHDFNSAGRREYEAAISELRTALEPRP